MSTLRGRELQQAAECCGTRRGLSASSHSLHRPPKGCPKRGDSAAMERLPDRVPPFRIPLRGSAMLRLRSLVPRLRAGQTGIPPYGRSLAAPPPRFIFPRTCTGDLTYVLGGGDAPHHIYGIRHGTWDTGHVTWETGSVCDAQDVT